MKKPNYLAEYYSACDNLIEEFIDEYFEGTEGGVDWYWIGDEVGGVLGVNDYFFNMDDVVKIMEIKPTWDRIDEAYYYLLDCHQNKKEPKINFENYLKYGMVK